MSELRLDLQAIAALVTPGASVIDVGCGEGELLEWLWQQKKVSGRGIEISQQRVNRAIARGLSVVQGDANCDLSFYPTQAYDYAILSQTLQTLQNPRDVLEQLLRIGRRVIVSVPNFGHWKNRLYLLYHGRMPVTRSLSYEWYDTPNIHFCTIRDFVVLCETLGLVIEQRLWVSHQGVPAAHYRREWLANLFGEQGVFMIRK
jgi:methionine biosynthesis protein MetW